MRCAGRKGRPASGQVLYTWGLNDRRQLGALSCRKDTAKNVIECTPDDENRLEPSAVATLNYTKIGRIAMNRDATFVQGSVARETLETLKPCTGACKEGQDEAAGSGPDERMASGVSSGVPGVAGEEEVEAWLSWGWGKRIGRCAAWRKRALASLRSLRA